MESTEPIPTEPIPIDKGTEAERKVCFTKIEDCGYKAFPCQKSRSNCEKIHNWIKENQFEWKEIKKSINSNGER